jgi:plasmid stability protein
MATARGQARLAVNLPIELHKQLKIRAAEEGMTIRDYILKLLRKAGVG